MKTIAEVKESKNMNGNFDVRKFKVNVETRVLRKKNTRTKGKQTLTDNVTMATLNKKIESMAIRMYNLENKIKNIHKIKGRNIMRKSTLPMIYERMPFIDSQNTMESQE